MSHRFDPDTALDAHRIRSRQHKIMALNHHWHRPSLLQESTAKYHAQEKLAGAPIIQSAHRTYQNTVTANAQPIPLGYRPHLNAGLNHNHGRYRGAWAKPRLGAKVPALHRNRRNLWSPRK